MDCQDCRDRSSEIGEWYRTLCDRHRAELSARVLELKDYPKKSNNDYSQVEGY